MRSQHASSPPAALDLMGAVVVVLAWRRGRCACRPANCGARPYRTLCHATRMGALSHPHSNVCCMMPDWCRYVNGRHYSRTLEDWLKLHDAAKSQIMPLFQQVRPLYRTIRRHCASLFAGTAQHLLAALWVLCQQAERCQQHTVRSCCCWEQVRPCCCLLCAHLRSCVCWRQARRMLQGVAS